MKTLISQQDTHIIMADTKKSRYLLGYLRENPNCELSDLIENLFLSPSENDLNTLYKEAKKKRKEKRENEDLEYRTKWNISVVEIEFPNGEYDPANLAVDISISTPEGNKYIANFVTRKFLDYIFEKNRRTGECSSGTYFCMPGMVVLEEITQSSVKKTIEDLIQNREMEEYFRNYDA